MNCRNLILIAGVCLLINSCVKRDVRPPSDMGSSLVTQARQYFVDSIQAVGGALQSYPSKIPKKIHWERVSPVR